MSRWTSISSAESGRYTVDATSDANTIQATLHASEPARGMVAGIAGLPDVGAITFDGRCRDRATRWPRMSRWRPVRCTPRPAARSTSCTQAADLMVSAQAPAMQPRPDVAWQSVSLDAHVHWAFHPADATGRAAASTP